MQKPDISLDSSITLVDLTKQRVKQTPQRTAFHQYDSNSSSWNTYTWQQTADFIEQWKRALSASGIKKGDCIGICCRNSYHWVLYDQAALALGILLVPLYVDDRAENAAYIIGETELKLLLIQSEEKCNEIKAALDGDDHKLEQFIIVEGTPDITENTTDITTWLSGHDQGTNIADAEISPDDVASLVFTSGTSGKPKGVMLTHKNMVSQVLSINDICVLEFCKERFLSFLPLSHMLERTAGYYLAIGIGGEVLFNRSIDDLAEDILYFKPTTLISVPRIFERIYIGIQKKLREKGKVAQFLFNSTVSVGWNRFETEQGRSTLKFSNIFWPILDKIVAKPIREKLGGELKVPISGGAALPAHISKTFTSLGINVLQGYGMTECSPVVSVNIPSKNKPHTIGLALPGVEVRVGENDELQVKGDLTMEGYLNDPEETNRIYTEDGWLKTGDQAAIDDEGFIKLTGRLKDILVLATGEKIPPDDMEAAIIRDTLFEQVLIIGEGRAFLTVLAVPNKDAWSSDPVLSKYSLDTISDSQEMPCHDYLIERIAKSTKEFPGYARIRKVSICKDEWTVENSLLTPTLKKKRRIIINKYCEIIENMYFGH